MTRHEIQTPVFRLISFSRFGLSPMLRVYIEGDGHPWARVDRPSDDPTPWYPVGLELAARDPAPSVAYLGRPCQYVAPGSDPYRTLSAWTGARYGEPVIASTNDAIDRLKAASGAISLELVGYSGGGAVAALIAARRNDIVNLRTVAANLDTAFWTARQGVSPLTGSLNPADFTDRLQYLPQIHFSGVNDNIVETAVFRSFAARFGRVDCLNLMIAKNIGHRDGWLHFWHELLEVPVRCGAR